MMHSLSTHEQLSTGAHEKGVNVIRTSGETSDVVHVCETNQHRGSGRTCGPVHVQQ